MKGVLQILRAMAWTVLGSQAAPKLHFETRQYSTDHLLLAAKEEETLRSYVLVEQWTHGYHAVSYTLCNHAKCTNVQTQPKPLLPHKYLTLQQCGSLPVIPVQFQA